jgi:hypothetical protein
MLSGAAGRREFVASSLYVVTCKVYWQLLNVISSGLTDERELNGQINTHLKAQSAFTYLHRTKVT